MIRKVELVDLCEKIFSGGTPDKTKPEYWDGTIPWLNSGETRNDFILETEDKITELGVKNSATQLALKGDIVMASAGQGKTRGQASFCLIDTYVNQSVIVMRANQEKIDPLYLFYNLKYCYDELRHFSDSQSSRGSLTKGLMSIFKIRLVPIPQQKKISKILYVLDEKILLNQKINKILEDILQITFMHWFIDFEFPDKSGKPYKSNGNVMMNHDNSMTYSTFCKQIPKGWKNKKISEITNVTDCLHSKKPEIINDGQLFLEHENIGENGKIDLEKTSHISQSDYDLWTSRIEVHQGDIVVINAPAGHVAQIPYFLNGSIGRNLTALRPKLDCVQPTFLLEYFLSKYMRAEIYKKSTTGTILNSINVQNIESLSILMPPLEVIEKFEKISRPLRFKIENNLQQNKILTEIKNILIQKFIKDGIDV